MKKIIYMIVLIIGLLLTASESETANVAPNIIGAAMFVFSAYKLRLFSGQQTEP